MAAAVDVDLPGNKKCLLMMMANYADENGFCYPSVSTLAQDAGVSERSVQNYLAEFAEKGIIEVHTRKTESGSTTSNLYRLMLHKAPQIVRARKARNNRGANTAPYPANDDKVGCNGCGEGVQPFPDGGATVAPKPITEPITETVIEPVDDAGASSSTQAVDCADHDHTDATDTHVGTIPASEADDPFLSNLFSQAPDETLPVGLMPQGATRDKFAMHFEWVPSEWFAERCRTSGVNLTRLEPEQQEAILGEFRSYWEARGDTATQAQWEHKLLNQLQRVAARASGQQPYGPATPQQKRAAVSEAIMNINDTDW
jgi:hypothetical protein